MDENNGCAEFERLLDVAVDNGEILNFLLIAASSSKAVS